MSAARCPACVANRANGLDEEEVRERHEQAAAKYPIPAWDEPLPSVRDGE